MPMIKKLFILSFLLLIFSTDGFFIYHEISSHAASDFVMFYHSAHYFWQGKSIYAAIPWEQYHFSFALSKAQIAQLVSGSNNVNPPTLTLLLLPLGLWSEVSAAV